MKLTFLRTPGGLPLFREGTTHDVPTDAAKKFVAAGIAVEASAVKAGPSARGEDGPTDEEIEAAANRVEFTARGEDSKANRPPPESGPVPAGAKANAQRSQPQNAGGADAGGDDLDGKTVAELKELAAGEGVDLPTKATKAEIVDAIAAARKK